MKVICNTTDLTREECLTCEKVKLHEGTPFDKCSHYPQIHMIDPFQLILGIQSPSVKELIDPVKDRELIIAFAEFANRLGGCIGLAANQVFFNQRTLVKRFFVVRYSGGWTPILNPQIIKYHGSPRLKTEGCKTWPGQPIVVYRYPKIEVVFQTLFVDSEKESRKIQKEMVAFEAQVFQHEIDHLNGVEEKFTNCIRREVVGRNEKCPCGSGEKYKNCCLNKDLK